MFTIASIQQKFGLFTPEIRDKTINIVSFQSRKLVFITMKYFKLFTHYKTAYVNKILYPEEITYYDCSLCNRRGIPLSGKRYYDPQLSIQINTSARQTHELKR